MSKILITGVCGLLGQHFSRYLINKGYSVVGIDDLSGGFKEYLDPKVEFYESDFTDSNHLKSIFKYEYPDYVVHFGAYASEGLSDYIKNYNYNNNIIGSVNIINNCVNFNVKKLLFTSSMAVMGEGKPPFKETDIPAPCDSYGIAKWAVEKELEITKKKFGLDYSIIRGHNIISSKYQNYSDLYRNVLGIWCNQILNNKNITIYGSGLQKRAFSEMKYICEPIEKLLYSFGGEIFNLGGDQEITIIDAARLMQKVATELGYNPEIEHLEARTEVQFAFCDHTKAKQLLSFKDETNLEEVMREMLIWVAAQPKRESRKMNYEINKGMYSYWK